MRVHYLIKVVEEERNGPIIVNAPTLNDRQRVQIALRLLERVEYEAPNPYDCPISRAIANLEDWRPDED